MHFLIIDDDPEDVEYFIEVVNRVIPECYCDIAKTCEEGLNKLKEAVDLPSHIFLDGMLYGMSSQECLQTLKADERLNKVHIVMYSGYAPSYVKLDFLNLGADKFIIKPNNSADLEKALQEILLM